MIDVILLERIERLGQMGQVVKVRPGFARNFLLPQKKALRATKANIDLFEKQRAQHEAHNNAERAKAEKLGASMDGVKLVVIRQASETGQLYGSVTSRDVAEAAKEAGHAIHRSQVHIDNPVKMLGFFDVKVKLHPEVTIKVAINVARTPEEAEVQAEKEAAAAKTKKEKADVVAAFNAPAETAEGEEKPKKAKAKKEAKDDHGDEDEAEEKPKKAAKAKAHKDEDDEPKAKKIAKAKK
jgi:large subunit ribosomal protein L9